MKRSKETSPPYKPSEMDLKKQWNASLPYPVWPFGTVDPAELKKWGRRNKTALSATTDEYEEALM
jgi:hypothetical protein